MARHSSGQKNFKLSPFLTIAVIAIVAVIIALIMWWRSTDSTDDTSAQADGTTATATTAATAAECAAGDLTLPIGGDAIAVDTAVAEFNASDTVTRDFCVTAAAAAPGEPAATYLFAGSRADAAAAFADTGAVAAGSEDSWPQVAAVPAGAAAAAGAAADLDSLSFPVASNPTVSAAVALALADDEEAAAGALSDDLDTTADAAAGTPAFAALESEQLPEGYTFEAVDGAQVPVWAIAVNADEQINEDQARAGADFTSAVSTEATVDDAAFATVLDQAQVIAAEKAVAQAEVPAAPLAAPSDTLIVLDTSSNMDKVVDGTQESYHTMTSTILSDLARETGGMGNQVALNNYSSPINPGVTRGWRPNVSFPDGSNGNNAANAIARFGTGGVPLTRASAVAAASIGAEHAAASGREVRIVLVTTGSASDFKDENFLADIAAAGGDKVSLHVIHVGHGPVDQVLTDYAVSNGGSAVTATNPQQVNDTLRAAFGF